MNTLHHPSLLQLPLRHATNTVRSEVRVARLYAPQTAQVLVALLLPLRDEVAVCDTLAEAVIVEFLADGPFSLVVEVEDVARALVVDAEDRPEGFHFALALVRVLFGFAHLSVQFV